MTDETAAAEAPPPSRALAELVPGGLPSAIVPRSIEEVFRLSKAFAASGVMPSTLNSPEKVMLAMMAGAELGMAPYQGVRSFYVVNNQLALWGDAIPALLWSNGFDIDEWFEGEAPGYPDTMTAHCKVTRPNGKAVERKFSVLDAKEAKLWTKDGSWQTAKRRMLQMRARAFAARDGATDVLRGMAIREEVEDVEIRTGRPQPSGVAAKLGSHGQPGSGFDPAGVVAALGEAEPTPEPARAARSPRKAKEPAPPKDTAQPAEPPGASAGAADAGIPHDPVTGEILDAEFEDVTGPQGDAPSVEGASATSESATDASAGSAEATSGPTPPSEPTSDGAAQAPAASVRTPEQIAADYTASAKKLAARDKATSTDEHLEDHHQEGEQSQGETTSPSPPSSDASPDAATSPLIEALALIPQLPDWPGVLGFLREISTTGAYKAANEDGRDVIKGAAWTRYADLYKAGIENTEPFQDYHLFSLWLRFGALTDKEVEIEWPRFWRNKAFRDASPDAQNKITLLSEARKKELRG